MYWVYILKCAGGSDYTGSTRDLVHRAADHNNRVFPDCYTASVLPVALVWSAEFPDHDAAFRCERQIKVWPRAKNEALIRGGPEAVHSLLWAQRKQHRLEKEESK